MVQLPSPPRAASTRRIRRRAAALLAEKAPRYTVRASPRLTAGVEGGASHPDRGPHRTGNPRSEIGLALSRHDATDVVRPGRPQRGDRLRHVTRREHRMAINPNDDLVLSRCQRPVQSCRDVAARIVDDDDPRILFGQAFGNAAGSVAARADCHNDLQLAPGSPASGRVPRPPRGAASSRTVM